MVSPSELVSLYLTANKEISDSVGVYTEILWNQRKSSQDYLYSYSTPDLPGTNPNSPFNYANNPDYVDASGKPLRTAASDMLFLFQQQPEQQVRYLNSIFGLRGRLSSKWDWDLYCNFSRSDASYSQKFIYADRLAASAGADGCNETLLTTATACPVGGIDFWSAYVNGFTDEEEAFLVGRDTSRTVYEQAYLEGIVLGDMFDLPHGTVSGAFGFHIRNESINDQPGQNAKNRSLALNFDPVSLPTVGDANARELFGEVAIPLLRDIPFAERLDLSLSGRLSDFQYGGTATTYKIGLSWMPTKWLMFRGTQGTSFRSPKLYELFLQDQAGLSSRRAVDACSGYFVSAKLSDEMRARCSEIFRGINYNATGNVTLLTGGSTDLEPETAITRTAGIVLTPGFIDASLSVDYYDIKIDNSVTKLGSVNIVRECLAANDYPDSKYCALITRDPVKGDILTVRNDYMNLGSTHVRGIDFVFSVAHDTPIGRIGFNGDVNYQLKNESATFKGDEPQSFLGYISYPKVISNLSLWLKPMKNTTITLGARLVGAMSNADYYTGASPVLAQYRGTGVTVVHDRKTEFYKNFSLSVSTRLADIADVTFGVRNLFDVAPPKISTGGTGWGQYREGTSSSLPFYDRLGRTFFLSLAKNF